MRSVLLKNLRAFCKDDDGVTLVEYGIAIVLAVTVGTIGLIPLGNQINTSLGVAGAAMP